jgi:LmbE family N-acetylglucosaminyl deacetylase
MLNKPDILKNSVIIAAHPDDELLWFNSVLSEVDQVYIVFRDYWAQPELGPKRSAAIAEFPRPNVECLNIPESGCYGCANWDDPVENESGLSLFPGEAVRELRRQAKMALRSVGIGQALKFPGTRISTIYEENAKRLEAALRSRLRADMNVFTHNPWGEYGHEEHVQLCRILQKLRREIGFHLWMSNYCTDRTLNFAQRYFEMPKNGYIRLPTNKVFAQQVADVYRKHDCWTWDDNWAWFDDECFMEMPESSSAAVPHRHLVPMNLFTIDAKPANQYRRKAVGAAAASAATAAALAAALDL